MRLTCRRTSADASPRPSAARDPRRRTQGSDSLATELGPGSAQSCKPLTVATPPLGKPGMSLLGMRLLVVGVRATMYPVRTHLAKRGEARIAARARS